MAFVLISTGINAQVNDEQEFEKTTTIASFLDTYILDLYNGLDAGASVYYAKDFYKKGKHSFAYKSSFGFFNSIDTENRYILGLGAQYRFEPTKRSNIRVSVSANYILTNFLYDRYEYNTKGGFIKQKNTKSNFGPSIELQYSYDVFRIKKVWFAPVIGYKLIKLDGGNYAKITEGFESGISLGIVCKF